MENKITPICLSLRRRERGARLIIGDMILMIAEKASPTVIEWMTSKVFACAKCEQRTKYVKEELTSTKPVWLASLVCFHCHGYMLVSTRSLIAANARSVFIPGRLSRFYDSLRPFQLIKNQQITSSDSLTFSKRCSNNIGNNIVTKRHTQKPNSSMCWCCKKSRDVLRNVERNIPCDAISDVLFFFFRETKETQLVGVGNVGTMCCLSPRYRFFLSSHFHKTQIFVLWWFMDQFRASLFSIIVARRKAIALFSVRMNRIWLDRCCQSTDQLSPCVGDFARVRRLTFIKMRSFPFNVRQWNRMIRKCGRMVAHGGGERQWSSDIKMRVTFSHLRTHKKKVELMSRRETLNSNDDCYETLHTRPR